MLIEGEGAPACVNTTLVTLPEEEGGIPLCIEDEEERIREASEANFVASCAQRPPSHHHPKKLKGHPLTLPLALFFSLSLAISRVFVQRLKRRTP